MKNITAEEIYQSYHKYSFYFKKGIHPKTIKNFSNVKSKPDWIYFEKCASLVNNNAGQVNHNLLVYSLCKFFEGRFNCKMLIHPKGLKIYKTFIETINQSNDSKTIEKGIIKSIQFITMFCIDHNIKDFNDYIYHNYELIGSLLKHYKAGSITKHFLVMIPSIIKILDNFPQDVKDSYLGDFKEKYPTIRAVILHEEKLRNIADNIENIINIYIRKKRNLIKE